MPVVVWRWLRWSLKYGLSDIGCVAFATHGIILVSMNDLKGGFEIAKITEQLLERLKPMDQMSYALMCTDNFVKAWTVPVQKLIAPCVKNCEIGLKAGDNEAAMWHVFYAGCFSWIAGNKNLIYMEDLLGQYCETIQFYQQDAIYNCLVRVRCFCHCCRCCCCRPCLFHLRSASTHIKNLSPHPFAHRYRIVRRF